MTSRLFLSKWTGQLPIRRFWLSVCTIVGSALILFLSTPSAVQAQSGITSPASGSAVSGDVVIMGTAVIDPFQKYELHYKPEPTGDDAFIYFDGNTVQVTNGQLGTWRAAALPPGIYSIRLRVVKADGNYAEFPVSNLSVNQGAAPTPTEAVTNSLTITTTATVDPLNAGQPTETPIPTLTFTPGPQPTTVVGQVTQPQVEGSLSTSTPTAPAVALGSVVTDSLSSNGVITGDVAVLFDATQAATPSAPASSVTRELGEAVAINRLRSFFFSGMRLSATLILGGVVLLLGKRLFGWVWTQYR